MTPEILTLRALGALRAGRVAYEQARSLGAGEPESERAALVAWYAGVPEGVWCRLARPDPSKLSAVIVEGEPRPDPAPWPAFYSPDFYSLVRVEARSIVTPVLYVAGSPSRLLTGPRFQEVAGVNVDPADARCGLVSIPGELAGCRLEPRAGVIVFARTYESDQEAGL